MYCTQQDIEAIYGMENVRVWSNLENQSGETDSNRISSAIEYAMAYLDQSFRGGIYQLPLSGLDQGGQRLVKELAARAAGWWLRQSRLNDVSEMVTTQDPILLNTVASIQSGRINPQWQRVVSNHGPVVVDSSEVR